MRSVRNDCVAADAIPNARHRRESAPMKELLRSTDVVRLSWLTALLADADIIAIVLDSHMSVVEGSINAIPRRLMVAPDDFWAARRILTEAGESLPDA